MEYGIDVLLLIVKLWIACGVAAALFMIKKDIVYGFQRRAAGLPFIDWPYNSSKPCGVGCYFLCILVWIVGGVYSFRYEIKNR